MPSAPHKRQPQRRVLEELLAASGPALVEPTPLDPAPLDPAPAPAPAAGRAAPVAPPPAATSRLSIHLPPAVLDRARDTVYHLPGFTLSGLVAAALTRELDRLEQQRGEPFPARGGPLRTGRPIR